MPITQKPLSLRKGDTIAVISPSAPSSQAQLDEGKAWLEAQGFIVKLMPHAASKDIYMAGTDEQRLSDLIAAIEDPSIDAVLCARGGYGSGRLLPLLPWQRWRNEKLPCKLLMGFSDITMLHQAVYQELGWVSFYSPMLTSNLIDPDAHVSREYWLKAVTEEHYTTLPLVIPNQDAYTCLKEGIVTGTLRGGNLSLIAALCGTKWHPHYTDAIVVIEDWKESYYTLDRQFTQLIQAGIFDNTKGILFADFSQIKNEGDRNLHDHLGYLCREANLPMGAGFTIGHGAQTLAIPLGVQATLDAQVGSLTIEESPFRPR